MKNELTNRIKNAVAQATNSSITKEELEGLDNLTVFNINSLNFLKVIVAIEDEFEIEFDDSELDASKFNSLDELSEFIETKIAEVEKVN